jgi:Uncharacterized protein conserved in bacteria (DUF2066)
MRQNLRRLGRSTFALLILLGLATVGDASAQDVFTVSDVLVDETAASADAARTAALAKGESLAWRLLIQRLVLAQDQERVLRVGGAQITDMIRSFSVDDERVSSERYKASLTYRFNADEVRRVIRQQNVPFAESPGPVLLVLPVIIQGGTATLWTEGESWLQAWQNAPPGHGLIQFRAPFGDLSDLLAIDAQGALDGNWNLMQPLARQYGADGVLVAVIDTDGGVGLDLTQYTEAIGQQVPVARSPVLGQSGETLGPERLAAAAELADFSVNEAWKEANLLSMDAASTIVVDVTLNDLADWIAVRKLLKDQAIVESVEPMVLSSTAARLKVTFLGDIVRLQTALRQNGYALVDQGDDWVIYPL